MTHRDHVFVAPVAEVYETCMVPMLFEPYAADLVNRLGARDAGRVLEIGAGTGVVTRALAASLPRHNPIVAIDLNPAMLERAAAVGTAREVEWRQADVASLPFPDGSFDTVVCQFAAMFFPHKPRAYSEVRRVLRPGGLFLFNVWDRLSENEVADTVDAAVASLFPDDPPRFMARTPHGYHDRALIERDLAQGGFDPPAKVETVAARSRCASARVAAVALCQGTPLRNEIEVRDARGLETATTAAATALAQRFGTGPIDGRMQAHVVAIER